MALSPGSTLGPYRITAPLAPAAWARFYRARDTTLDRDVAIKVLPEAFAADADRLARFEREAKVLAAVERQRQNEGPPVTSVDSPARTPSGCQPWQRNSRRDLRRRGGPFNSSRFNCLFTPPLHEPRPWSSVRS